MFSLKEISRLTADTWKTIDNETLDYLTAVARLILERFKQIETDLGGPLEKKSRSKTNKNMSLLEQPPKVSTSASAGVYGSWRSPPNMSKGNEDARPEPLNLHDVDGFWESVGVAAAYPQAPLSQGASAVGYRQPASLVVGKMGPEEIRRPYPPSVSDLETNWENAIACTQAHPRPSRRASVEHTAPASHAAAMSHLKTLGGLTVGNTGLKEFRRPSLPNLEDLRANSEGRTCPISFQQASMSLGHLPVQAQLLEMKQHSRAGQALSNNPLPPSVTTNHDFLFATDGGANRTRQNVSTNHAVTSSCGTISSSINSVFDGQGPGEFGLESDGQCRKSVVSLDLSAHSIAASRRPSPDILRSIETRPPSGLVHQMTREDCSVNLLLERLVEGIEGDMSDAVDMSDDDIKQMLSSSNPC